MSSHMIKNELANFHIVKPSCTSIGYFQRVRSKELASEMLDSIVNSSTFKHNLLIQFLKTETFYSGMYWTVYFVYKVNWYIPYYGNNVMKYISASRTEECTEMNIKYQ